MKKIVIFMIAMLLVTGVITVSATFTAFGNISEAGEKEQAEPPQKSVDSLEIRRITVPAPESRNNSATIAEGFVYYIGQKGVVYQAPLDDTADAKPVYQLPDGNSYSDDGYALSWLTTVDGTAILKYHMGGASMGTDYTVALYSDGSCEDLNGSYSSSVRTEDAMIVLASDYPSSDLEIRRANDKTFTALGEAGYSYGLYTITDSQGGRGFVSNSDLAVIGDDVYVLATKWNDSEKIAEPVGLYQVNTKTNATKRVFQEPINRFEVDNGCIYYTDFDGLLYKTEIGTDQAEKVSDIGMDEFFIMGNEIYYTPFQPIDGSGGPRELWKLGGSKALAPGSVLDWPEMDANRNEGYLACRLYELDTYPLRYRGMVMDKSGGIVFLEPGDIQYITVHDGVIYEVVRGEEGIPAQAVNADAQQEIKLVIDDMQVVFSPADGFGTPFIQYDKTMVPLRKPLEAVGADVSYDAGSRTAIIRKDDIEISVTVDGGMLVNGSAYHVDAPAMIKNDRVYVPVRHIFEALGYSLSWEKETKTVNIKKTDLP